MLESEAPSIFLFPILAPAIREHRGFEAVAKGCERQLRLAQRFSSFFGGRKHWGLQHDLRFPSL